MCRIGRDVSNISAMTAGTLGNEGLDLWFRADKPFPDKGARKIGPMQP